MSNLEACVGDEKCLQFPRFVHEVCQGLRFLENLFMSCLNAIIVGDRMTDVRMSGV